MAADDGRDLARAKEILENISGENKLTQELRQLREEVAAARESHTQQIRELTVLATAIASQRQAPVEMSDAEAVNSDLIKIISPREIDELRRELDELRSMVRDAQEAAWARQHTVNLTKDAVAELQTQTSDLAKSIQESIEASWARQHVMNVTHESVTDLRGLVSEVGGLVQQMLEGGWARQHAINVTQEKVANLQGQVSDVGGLVQQALESGWARQHVMNVTKDSVDELQGQLSQVVGLVQQTLDSGWARQHVINMTKDATFELQGHVAEVGGLVRQVLESGWARQHTINVTAETVREIRQLVGPVGIPFPDNTLLTRTIHGILYYVDAADTIITPQLLIYRQWEPDLTELFFAMLDGCRVFVDVGANIGYFTCLVATRMGAGGGRVFAFEPNPKLTPIIRKNLAVNWSAAPVELFEKAVSSEAGTATLFIPSDRGANASMGAASAHGADVEVVVPMTTLDDSLPSDLEVDILKIDIEGFELYALQGARSVIARSPNIKIIMEWSMVQMRGANTNPRDIADYFTELGFLVFDITQRDFSFPAKDALDWETILTTEYANLLLARPQVQ